MAKSVAVGAKSKEHKSLGAFEVQWVTVWGVYVPDLWMPSVLLALDLAGMPGRQRGNTVQVKYQPDNPDHIENVRTFVREFADQAWNKPPTPDELAPYLVLAEIEMRGGLA